MLMPHISSGSYYVAFQDTYQRPTVTYDLGTGSRTAHNGSIFTNAPLNGNTDYYVFIRAYSRLDQVCADSANRVNGCSMISDTMVTKLLKKLGTLFCVCILFACV